MKVARFATVSRTPILEVFGYIVMRFHIARILADPGGTANAILAGLRLERM